MREARVGCAILAAGAGARFGPPGKKLLAAYRGKALVAHAIDAACGSSSATCALIVGAAYERVVAAIDPRRCSTIVNAAWREGLASSIRCAIASLDTSDAVILMLADQPHVGAQDLNALMCAHVAHPRAIVALRAGRVWGAPVLFPASDGAALRRLRGDAGAKMYARSQSARLVFVQACRADAFADVDEAADIMPANGRRSRRTRRSPARR